MRLKEKLLLGALACLLLCWPSVAARPMSRYLGFGKKLLVVTNEPGRSPVLQLLSTRVPVKDTVICSPANSDSRLEDLERGDVTLVVLLNHNRGSMPPELPGEVLNRTTFAPLPSISKNTLLTICRRRQQNPDLLEAFLAAPDSVRLEKELKRLLNSTAGVPYFRKTEVLYCAVIASRPEYAQRFISSLSAIEAQVFTFKDEEAFLQAANNNTEIYIVNRQDRTAIPETILKRMPINPFSLRPNQAVCARTEKEGHEAVMLYTAPAERFLLPLLWESRPKAVSLPDLSSARAVAVSDVYGSPGFRGDYGLVQEASDLLSEAVFKLCQEEGLALVERRRFREIAEELGLQSSGLFDEATVARIGKLAGAQAIIVAEVPTVRRETEHRFSERRVREWLRRRWAWHWTEKVQDHAEVMVNLRVAEVETATQLWNATVSASQDGQEIGLRSEAKDESGGRKPAVPSWFGEDYSSPGSSDALVSRALARAIGGAVERLKQEVLWASDLVPLAEVSLEGEILGTVETVQGGMVFVSIQEGIEFLRPGSTLYVVEETKLGPDIYRRKKATLVVRVVKTESAQCAMQSLEPGESVEQFDLVTSRLEAGPR